MFDAAVWRSLVRRLPVRGVVAFAFCQHRLRRRELILCSRVFNMPLEEEAVAVRRFAEELCVGWESPSRVPDVRCLEDQTHRLTRPQGNGVGSGTLAQRSMVESRELQGACECLMGLYLTTRCAWEFLRTGYQPMLDESIEASLRGGEYLALHEVVNCYSTAASFSAGEVPPSLGEAFCLDDCAAVVDPRKLSEPPSW